MTGADKEIIGLYRRHADAWVRLRSGSKLARSDTMPEAAWLNKFQNILPDTPTILDLGCGYGEPIARYLSDSGGVITGVDTSRELIAEAKDRAPGSTWVVSDMRTVSLPMKFNGILAWNSAFHLTPDDQRAMFPVYQRHAADGAALMFTSGTSIGIAMGEFEGEPLYHASLEPSEFRSLLAAHGFEVIDHVKEDPDCGGLTIWLARYVGAKQI